MFMFVLRAVTPPNPHALPSTNQDAGTEEEEMNKAGEEIVSTSGGEIKPTTFPETVPL